MRQIYKNKRTSTEQKEREPQSKAHDNEMGQTANSATVFDVNVNADAGADVDIVQRDVWIKVKRVHWAVRSADATTETVSEEHV